MKPLKYSLTMLLIAFISLNVNAQIDNSLSFSLNTDSLFKAGNAALKDGGIITLGKIAKKINLMNRAANHFKNIVIEGHTDDMGSSDSNQMLSERRANIIANLLKKTITNSDIKWTVKGHGESKPKVDNSTSENRKINRRIDIYVNSNSEITPKIEIKPSTQSTSFKLLQKDQAQESVMTNQHTVSNQLWLNSLGKTPTSHEIKIIYDLLGQSDAIKEDENSLGSMLSSDWFTTKQWYAEGLELKFRKNEYNMLKFITFYNKNNEFNTYSKKLPFGLSFSDSPSSLKRKFSNIKKDQNGYDIIFDEKNYPNLYLDIHLVNEKITSITLSRKQYNSYPPFKIDKDVSDCEMVATILKDIKYDFSHLRNIQDPTAIFSAEWSSILNPSFSKNTILESNLINFEIYKGTDLELASKNLTTINESFIECVKKNGYKIILSPPDSENSLTYYSEDETFFIDVFIDEDTETFNGKEQVVYTSTINITNYTDYSECEFYDLLYENALSNFKYLKAGISDTHILGDTYKSNITIYDFIAHEITGGSYKASVYQGFNKEEANNKLSDIFYSWKDCMENSERTFIFIDDINSTEKHGSRKIRYSTLKDNIIIRFNYNKSFELDENNKIKDLYNVSVSFFTIETK